MQIKLPSLFLERMQQLLSAKDYAAFLSSYQSDFQPSLRVNTLKISVTEFKNLFSREIFSPIPWTDQGFFIEKKGAFSKTPYYHSGLFYIQEAASMLPVEAMDIQPGDIILDACASPGSKTTQIISKTENQGMVIANEFRRDRVGRLMENVSRWGASNTIITNQATHAFSGMLEFFDKILLDAPCSGEGMFKKDPDALKCWSLNNVQKCASTQKQLLSDLVPTLKTGGTLIYSTCTFAPEENEEVLQWLLDTYPGSFKIEPISYGSPSFSSYQGKTFQQTIANSRRLFPHLDPSEGFFVAKLTKIHPIDQEKSSALHSKNKPDILPKASTQLLKNFFSEIKLESKTALELQSSAYKIGYKYFYLPTAQYKKISSYLPTLKPVYLGLHLGNEKKNRLEPAMALALHLKTAQLKSENILNLTLDKTIDYLRGQEIFLDEKLNEGFKLICYENYPLGWANYKQQRLKNFFPKSLRNKL